MAVQRLPQTNEVFDNHRLEMIKLAREVNAQAGIPDDLDVTAEQVQEMMRALGIRAEDNIFSRDIICTRYEDEEE